MSCCFPSRRDDQTLDTHQSGSASKLPKHSSIKGNSKQLLRVNPEPTPEPKPDAREERKISESRPLPAKEQSSDEARPDTQPPARPLPLVEPTLGTKLPAVKPPTRPGTVEVREKRDTPLLATSSNISSNRSPSPIPSQTSEGSRDSTSNTGRQRKLSHEERIERLKQKAKIQKLNSQSAEEKKGTNAPKDEITFDDDEDDSLDESSSEECSDDSNESQGRVGTQPDISNSAEKPDDDDNLPLAVHKDSIAEKRPSQSTNLNTSFDLGSKFESLPHSILSQDGGQDNPQNIVRELNHQFSFSKWAPEFMKYNHLGFLSKITGPALYKEPLPSAPIEILELSHVYGFAHANDRNTVFFTHSLKPRLSALTTTSTYIHFLSSKVSVTAAIPPKTAGSGPRALVSSIPQDHHAHSQLITTACVHPGGTIIATASGQEIHIREDGEILGILEAPLTVTGSSPGAIDDSPRDDPDAWISAMTFIKNGVILVCAISTKLGTLIHLFDWRRKSLPITSFMGHSDTIFRVIANPWAKREFATVGISHIKWWSFIEPLLGKLPWADGKPPIAEESTPTFFTGIFNSHKLLITGSVFGDIYFWQRNSIQVVCRRMHRGPVYAMVSVPAPYSFLSGGDDARVVVWNEHLQPVNEVSFESIPPIPGQVRAIRSLDICYFDSEGKASGLLSRSATRKFSVAPRRSSKVPAIPDESTSSLFPSLSRTSTFNQPQGNAGRKPSNVRNPHQFQSVSVIVGCSDSTIWELDMNELDRTLLLEGHCTDNQWEVWGLAAHPIEATKFITVGDDGWAKVWSTQAQCVVFRRHFPNKLRACHYNPNGSVVAIGTDDGLIVVTSPDLKQTEISIKHRKDAIHDLKYSPNSKYLAAGCHDNFIDIYALETPTGFYQRIMCCRGHSCFITHLDWSADSIRLQSNSGNNEIMFWTIDTERASKGGTVAFKDVIWDTTNCVLQWATKGVYELPASSGPGSTQMQLGLRMVTSCERRRRNDVLLVGTTVGDVFLFRYPACTPAPQFKKFPGHGGPISNLVLLQDGTTVISVGAEDGSIFQWTLGGS